MIYIDRYLKKNTAYINIINIKRYKGNCNLQDRDGKSLLMIAAEKGYLELTRELIKAGANTNLTDRDGFIDLNNF